MELNEVFKDIVFLEADEIVVLKTALDSARDGDKEATEELLKLLDTVHLYEHAFSIKEGEVVVNANLLRTALENNKQGRGEQSSNQWIL